MIFESDYTDYRLSNPIDAASPTGFLTAATQLRDHGFAILHFPDTPKPEMALATVAGRLSLGEPIIPLLYQKKSTRQDFGGSYADITAKRNGGHPVFTSGEAQGWHTDGLLDEIGSIKTTLLYCVRPAAEGGHTTLLNSGRVFHELRSSDPEAANVLTDPSILGRRSTLPGVDAESRGPVFKLAKGGEYLTRYGDTAVECWYPRPEQVDPLRRALEYFKRSITNDPSVTLQVLLQSGDCLVFRNDLLSHSRDAFRDDPEQPRHLVRALHGNVPR